MPEKLVVRLAKGKGGFWIETESGEVVALTYRAGHVGGRWARRLAAAYNDSPSSVSESPKIGES